MEPIQGSNKFSSFALISLLGYTYHNNLFTYFALLYQLNETLHIFLWNWSLHFHVSKPAIQDAGSVHSPKTPTAAVARLPRHTPLIFMRNALSYFAHSLLLPTFLTLLSHNPFVGLLYPLELTLTVCEACRVCGVQTISDTPVFELYWRTLNRIIPNLWNLGCHLNKYSISHNRAFR